METAVAMRTTGTLAPQCRKVLAFLGRVLLVVLKWLAKEAKITFVDNTPAHATLFVYLLWRYATFARTSPRGELAFFTDIKWLALSAVKADGRTLHSLGAKFQSDKDVVLAAIRAEPRALIYASPGLRDDREVVLEAVQLVGETLASASQALQDDIDVVIAAVRQSGQALRYAHQSKRCHRDVVMAAVESTGSALEFASEILRDDQEIVLAAVQQDGTALRWASARLKRDKEIALAAVRQTGDALNHAAEELRADKEIVLTAAKHSMAALWLASQELLADMDFAVAAARQDEEALKFWTGEAHEMADFAAAVDTKLALPGEEGAPVLIVEVHFQDTMLQCKAAFPSGRTMEVTLDNVATIADLAVELVRQRPSDMDYQRVYLVIETDTPTVPEEGHTLEGEGTTTFAMNPWDYDLPVRGFGPGCKIVEMKGEGEPPNGPAWIVSNEAEQT